MAQQKKNGIQPISYSSLHEKLGESQRALRSSERKLSEAEADLRLAIYSTERQTNEVAKLKIKLTQTYLILTVVLILAVLSHY